METANEVSLLIITIWLYQNLRKPFLGSIQTKFSLLSKYYDWYQLTCCNLCEQLECEGCGVCISRGFSRCRGCLKRLVRSQGSPCLEMEGVGSLLLSSSPPPLVVVSWWLPRPSALTEGRSLGTLGGSIQRCCRGGCIFLDQKKLNQISFYTTSKRNGHLISPPQNIATQKNSLFLDNVLKMYNKQFQYVTEYSNLKFSDYIRLCKVMQISRQIIRFKKMHLLG